MALEGPLKELHIQDVFQLLDLGRKSGVLRVTSELRQSAATVSFDRGGVVAASLGSDDQPIGSGRGAGGGGRRAPAPPSRSARGWCGWARSPPSSSIVPGTCRTPATPGGWAT